MRLKMKKIIILCFTYLIITITADNSSAGCLKILDRDLSSTKSQLNKYSCKKKHSKDISFQCSKNAPDGWAKYYSVKFRNIEKKVINCLG